MMRYIGTTPNPYGDTLLTSDADDQINVKVAGAEDFRIAANTLSVLSGTTLNIDSGATIANSGTATGFGSFDPASPGEIGGTTPAAASFTSITGSGTSYIGDTANAGVTLGLTINQLTNDDHIIEWKSSDIAHGVTGFAETDTYGYIDKVSPTLGALRIVGLSESPQPYGINIRGLCPTNNTTHTTAGVGWVWLQGDKTSGSSLTDATAGQNVLYVSTSNNASSADVALFFVTEAGDLWADGGTSSSTMVTKYDDHIDHNIVGDFNKFLGKDAAPDFERMDYLAGLGIIGEISGEEWEKGDRPLVCYTQLAHLHNGWMVQAYERERVLWAALAMTVPGFAQAAGSMVEGRNIGALPTPI